MEPAVQPTYPDRALLLIGIPLLGILYRHIGEPTSLITLLRDPMYYLDLTVNVLVTAGLWLGNRYLILRLTERYPRLDQIFQRLLLQAALGILPSLALIVLVSFVYNDVLVERSEFFSLALVFMFDIPIGFLMLVIIHLLYLVLYLWTYLENQLAQPALVTVPAAASVDTSPKRSLLVYIGRSMKPLPLEALAYAYKADEITLVRTHDQQDYRTEHTLESLAAQLPPDQFYRLNRQLISSWHAIGQVRQDSATGKLLVELKPGFGHPVTVSRKKAAEFKEWMEK